MPRIVCLTGLVAAAFAIVPPPLARAAEYRVGPGQAYAQIGDVPWSSLAAGDTVYIHYRSEPYREKFLISGQGTPGNWIRVLGVPGPNGELPVISGDQATTSRNNRFRWQNPLLVQWSGVVHIAVQQVRADGSDAPLPAYIELAGLQIQDGHSSYQFTAEDGSRLDYDGFAACVYVRSARHVLIRDNVLTNCGQGFYNWTGDGERGGDTWWDGVARDITLRGNYFSGNGNAGSYTEHQSYTEADGVTIEFNRYGPQREGALGSQLKDRSAGTVIRYNYIEQSAAGWDIDLVEPQEGYSAFGGKPSYTQAFVYGNIIFNLGVRDPNFIHWNEDHQLNQGRADLAQGRLYFYHNTVLTVADAAGMQSFSLFNVTWGGYDCPGLAPGIIDVRNNIFAVLPRTPGAALPVQQFGYCGLENFDFGVNWVSPGYEIHGGSVTGIGNLISPAGNDPGFANVPGADLHLTAASSANGIGGPLAPEVTNNYLGGDFTPVHEYVYHQKAAVRTAPGGARSPLGAFDISSSPASFPVRLSSLPHGLRLVADGEVVTAAPLSWSAGTQHRIEAPSPQFIGGTMYLFSGWSDGGEASRSVTASPTVANYVASYIAKAAAPDAPLLVSPESAAADLGSYLQLTWTAAAYAQYYDIYLGTVPEPPFVASTTTPAANVAGLRLGTTYYWKVVARNGAGEAGSATRSFRTAGPQ